jgi:hypothetical protein
MLQQTPHEHIERQGEIEASQFLSHVHEIAGGVEGFDDFGEPHEQVLNIGPAGVTIACDDEQEESAKLKAYIEAEEDPEDDAPTFCPVYTVSVAPELMQTLPSGPVPLAFIEDNGGDYGAAVALEFCDLGEGLEAFSAPDPWSGGEGGLHLLVLNINDVTRQLVEFTFRTRFGVCAFT